MPAKVKAPEFCRCVNQAHNKTCNNVPTLSCNTCGGCMVCKGCAKDHHHGHQIGPFVQQ